jgi:hypothetical protein
MASTNVAARGALVKRLILLGALSLCSALPAWGQVTFTQGPEQIAVEIDGKPFTVFYISGKDLNRPYLHPLRSASGEVVNRSFPAGQLPGETTDHPHHAGLFYGHGDVNGYNYWAIENVPTAPSKTNATMGRIVLNEVLAHPDLRIIDFDFDFAAIGKVVFRDTKEGTFAMRMATALEEPSAQDQAKATAPSRTGKLMNAQGAEREANVWGKRSEWVDYSGMLDGEPVGVVMMDHPDNPRHPTYWHSRGYGLHSINPFGVSGFLNDKAQNGSLTLEPGQHVRFRYRVIIHLDASRADLAAMYKHYTQRH